MRLIDWFCDMATVLYVKSDSVNDFFLLHGVTGIIVFSALLHFTILRGFLENIFGVVVLVSRRTVSPPMESRGKFI